MSESREKETGIELREGVGAAGGFPDPAVEVTAVGFGGAAPALVDLLAGVIVPGSDGTSGSDPVTA